MNLTDIIKQQKEWVREEWLKAPFFNQFREGELQLLDTLTSQTVHATALAVIEMCEEVYEQEDKLAHERNELNKHYAAGVVRRLILSLKAQLPAEPLPERPFNNERE